MKKKTILVFVFDGFSDWGPSYALAGIGLSASYTIKTIAMKKSPVRSLGGVTILPDLDFFPATDLRDVEDDNTAMLILPGGSAWEEKTNMDIATLVRRCIEQDIPVAAIGGAAILLADLGLLDEREHTSNDPGYLQTFSHPYQGGKLYQFKPVVSHYPVITAAGMAALEFAGMIFATLGISGEEEVSRWLQCFKK